MKIPLLVLSLTVALGGFSFAEAAPTYTMTAECDLSTGTVYYESNGPAVGRYYDVYQGIVGYGELMNGSFAGNTDSFSHASTCDDLDDSLSSTTVHVNSYWFAATYPATDLTAFRAYFTGASLTPPNNNYAVSLCDNFGCLQLIQNTIGTSSALGLLDNQTATSTLDYIGEQCSQSGNIFSYGICVAFSYLFLPSPQVLNEWGTLASTSAQHFPISWFYEVRDAFSGITASSSTMTEFEFSMHDLGLGSTTAIGNVLPDATIFSTSTITHFMPAGVWVAIQALMAAALWLGLAADIWFTSRNLFHV